MPQSPAKPHGRPGGGDPAPAPAPVPAAAPEAPITFRFQALQDTWLKKGPVPAAVMADESKVKVEKGTALGVISTEELAEDSHALIELAAHSGRWYIYSPHFRRIPVGEPAVPADAGPVLTAAQIDWSNFSQQITPYLTVGEVLQFDARRLPRPGSADERRILATAEQHRQMRQAWGGPIGITSFYRPEPINSQVGGVSNSRHITGEAFDAYPVGRSLDDFYRWARDRWTGGLGDGRPRGFIHFDTRGGGGFVPGAGRRPAAEWLY